MPACTGATKSAKIQLKTLAHGCQHFLPRKHSMKMYPVVRSVERSVVLIGDNRTSRIGQYERELRCREKQPADHQIQHVSRGKTTAARIIESAGSLTSYQRSRIVIKKIGLTRSTRPRSRKYSFDFCGLAGSHGNQEYLQRATDR